MRWRNVAPSLTLGRWYSNLDCVRLGVATLVLFLGRLTPKIAGPWIVGLQWNGVFCDSSFQFSLQQAEMHNQYVRLGILSASFFPAGIMICLHVDSSPFFFFSLWLMLILIIM